MLRVPEPVLLGVVAVLSLVGAFGVRGNAFGLLVAITAGVLGFFLRYCGVPTAPIVIGMVLGPRFEESLRQGLILTDNSFLAFMQRPIALGLFIVTALILIASFAVELRARFTRTAEADTPAV